MVALISARRPLAACSKHLGRPQAHAMETIPVSELKDPQFSFYIYLISQKKYRNGGKTWENMGKGMKRMEAEEVSNWKKKMHNLYDDII